MTYNSIATMAEDTALRRRVAACAAQEGVPSPESWTVQQSLMWAGAPGWADAYDYAVATGNEAPGRDEAVITDGMILAQVQAMVT